MASEYEQVTRLLVAIALLLIAARFMGHVFIRLSQPRVVGEIVGGLILGPTCLSSLAPGVKSWVFPEMGFVSIALYVLAQLGLMLLMYNSGSEIQSLFHQGERRIVFVLIFIGTIVPFLAGVLFVLVFGSHELHGSAKNDVAFLLVFASAIAVTSIPVISRIMMDLKILKTAFARIVLATAVIEDLILYIVLAVALGLARTQTDDASQLSFVAFDSRTWSAAYFVTTTIMLFAGILVVGPMLLKWSNPLRLNSSCVAIQLVVLLAVVGVSTLLAVTPMFAALAAGLVAGGLTNQIDMQAREAIKRYSVAIFLPIYFAMIGLRLDLIREFSVFFFFAFLVFACAIKGLSIFVGARMLGKTNAGAVNLAIALNARGGPAIVMASITFDAGIISESFFAILVVVAVVTSLFAGSWLTYRLGHGASLL